MRRSSDDTARFPTVVGLVRRLGGPEHVDELFTSSRDPRSDGTDRDVEDLGGFVVSQAVQLGQDECRPSIVVEEMQQLVDFGAGPVDRRTLDLDPAELVEAASESTPSGSSPRAVGAGSPGDRE